MMYNKSGLVILLPHLFLFLVLYGGFFLFPISQLIYPISCHKQPQNSMRDMRILAGSQICNYFIAERYVNVGSISGHTLPSELNTLFRMDPVLIVLSSTGIIFAGIKRDFFVILWSIPFIIFAYFHSLDILFPFYPYSTGILYCSCSVVKLDVGEKCFLRGDHLTHVVVVNLNNGAKYQKKWIQRVE